MRAVLAYLEQRRDVRMRQPNGRLGRPNNLLQAFGRVYERAGKDPQGDSSPEARIPCPVQLAEAARTDVIEDRVVGNGLRHSRLWRNEIHAVPFAPGAV